MDRHDMLQYECESCFNEKLIQVNRKSQKCFNKELNMRKTLDALVIIA